MDVCYSSLDCESHTQKSNPTKLFQALEPEEHGIEILYAKNMIDEHEEYSFIQKELNPQISPSLLICTQVYQRIEFLQNV
jgi:hypothetical protein